MADGFSLGQCQCSLWSLAGVGSVTHGGAPGCSSRTPPAAPRCQSFAMQSPCPVPAWNCSVPGIPAISASAPKQGPSPGLGSPAGPRWKPAPGSQHHSTGRAQPELPATPMEICPSESQRIAPKLLEVVQDMAAFHTHNVQA